LAILIRIVPSDELPLAFLQDIHIVFSFPGLETRHKGYVDYTLQ
jgi:hypothetical protein